MTHNPTGMTEEEARTDKAIKSAFDDFMEAFEAFRMENDKRLRLLAADLRLARHKSEKASGALND